MRKLFLLFLLIIPTSLLAQINDLDKYYPADTLIKKAGVKKSIETGGNGREVIIVEYDREGLRIADYYQGNGRKNNYRCVRNGDTLFRISYVTVNDQHPADSVMERYTYNSSGQILLYQKWFNATDSSSSFLLNRFTYNQQGQLDTLLLYGFQRFNHRLNNGYVADERTMQLQNHYQYTWYQDGRLAVGQNLLEQAPYRVTDSNYFDEAHRPTYRHRSGLMLQGGKARTISSRQQISYEPLRKREVLTTGSSFGTSVRQSEAEFYPNGLLRSYKTYDEDGKAWKSEGEVVYEYY